MLLHIESVCVSTAECRITVLRRNINKLRRNINDDPTPDTVSSRDKTFYSKTLLHV